MIKLKTEVNKSAVMRELRKEAESMYDAAYEGEYAIEQFLYGAETLFKKLRISDVVGRSEQLKAFLSAMIEEFDNGGVSWETRDSAENLLKSL